MGKYYTDEEIETVKKYSLSHIAQSLGYTVVRKGNLFSLKEMDSLMIYEDKTWYRWSRKMGGDNIKFVQEFKGCSFEEAVKYIMDISHMNIGMNNKVVSAYVEKMKERKEFILPKKSETSYRRLYAYLIQKRGLSHSTIDYFIKNDILYESAEKHNMVFIGYDENKEPKYAGQRSTLDINGYVFKGDVAGNDKRYGVNIINKSSDTIKVFEGFIDMMSYCEYYTDFDKTNKVVLGMVSDAPLATVLEYNPGIKKIDFILDRDEAGRKALYGYVDDKNKYVPGLLEKYKKLGYEVQDEGEKVITSGKDFNEFLLIKKTENIENKNIRKNMQQHR